MSLLWTSKKWNINKLKCSEESEAYRVWVHVCKLSLLMDLLHFNHISFKMRDINTIAKIVEENKTLIWISMYFDLRISSLLVLLHRFILWSVQTNLNVYVRLLLSFSHHIFHIAREHKNCTKQYRLCNMM